MSNNRTNPAMPNNARHSWDEGLSKLEYAAIHILSGYVGNSDSTLVRETSFSEHADNALRAAKALFDKLEKTR